MQFKTDWTTTGQKWNSFALHSTDKRCHVLGIVTYYAFYISRSAVEHGSGQKSSFSTCLIWPLSTDKSFSLQVVGTKPHTEIFDSPLSERCWHGLGMSHDHPCLRRPDQTSTNIGRLDTNHNKHRPGRCQTKRRCRVCSAGDVKRTVIFR